MRATSIIAFYSILSELSKREKEVLLALKSIQPANNLMLGNYLNLPVNSITGRMKSLRDKGIVIYSHTSACPFTKETTRYFIIKSYLKDVLV
jgi:predicted transcriptional regulator